MQNPIGGDKTNNVPPNMNLPLPQMQQGESFLTGFTRLTGLPIMPRMSGYWMGILASLLCCHAVGTYPATFQCHTDQSFEIDANGTVRVIKFGYCGERKTNNVFTITRRIE